VLVWAGCAGVSVGAAVLWGSRSGGISQGFGSNASGDDDSGGAKSATRGSSGRENSNGN